MGIANNNHGYVWGVFGIRSFIKNLDIQALIMEMTLDKMSVR